MLKRNAQWLCLLGMAISIVSCTSGSDKQNHSVSTEKCVVDGIPTATYQRVFPKLNFKQPVGLLQSPNDQNRWYVLEKAGRVIYFANNDAVSSSSVYLDLTTQVDDKSEGGLLGLAFHPQFEINKYVYLSYTTSDVGDNFRSHISRFTANVGNTSLDPKSELVLISQEQPYGNHNGGNIAFGHDGYLYIGFGDGGSAGDPQNNAQDTTNLLGSMLRIDVNVAEQDSIKYKIPPTNPFASSPGCGSQKSCPEIYAWGLRNPWRWSFGQKTGDLWVGDVGQNDWEEINIIEQGKNYGWRCYEGSHKFNLSNCSGASNYTIPIAEYPQNGESRSITGGYIYRGTEISELKGHYVYADYVTGEIFVLTDAKGVGSWKSELLISTKLPIPSFGQSHSGELYFLSLYSPGAIYQIKKGEKSNQC